MVWYYDWDESEYIICDIYNIVIYWKGRTLYPFRLESNYRYSGLLYDKLKHITSHIYVDIYYKPQLSAPDQLHYAACRFDTRNMQFNYMYNRNTGDYTADYLEESIARNLHFINN